MTESRVAWLDVGAGVAGDMLLAALLDAGASFERVAAAVDSLGVPGLRVRTSRDRRGGFGCLRVHVDFPRADRAHRGLEDVLAMVQRTALEPAGKAYARQVFESLALAEGTVHGVPPSTVHFHEVGAHDALADVVGNAAALQDLGLLDADAFVSCSPLAVGSGTVRAAHGLMPVPTPAVLQLAALAGLRLAGGELSGERSTPTGVALLAAVAEPGEFPPMSVHGIGVGGGSRDTTDRPNITRVVLGSAPRTQPRGEGEVLLVESTVDDLDPQLWPAALSALRAAGAWDCWTAPITGRHGRPGRIVSAVCDESTRLPVVEAMFRHTTTIGVRWAPWRRVTLPRHTVTVHIGPQGNRCPVTIKVSELGDGGHTAKPELADAELAAERLGLPVRQVLDDSMAAFRAGGSSASEH